MPLRKLWNVFRGRTPSDVTPSEPTKPAAISGHRTLRPHVRPTVVAAKPARGILGLGRGPHHPLCRAIRKSGASSVLEDLHRRWNASDCGGRDTVESQSRRDDPICCDRRIRIEWRSFADPISSQPSPTCDSAADFPVECRRGRCPSRLHHRSGGSRPDRSRSHGDDRFIGRPVERSLAASDAPDSLVLASEG